MRSLALVIALLPTLAYAAPGEQLLRNVERGLREYRISADVDQLTTAQAAAIHLAVSAPDEENGVVRGSHTRQKILSILRWNDATNPDLQ